MNSPLPVRLRNSSNPKGTDRWSWSAWIEGPDNALDEIQSVRYVLHPTFPNPSRVVTDRSKNFMIESSGWGEFSLLAEVTPRTGLPFQLELWLTLDGPGASPLVDRRPTLFVSHSATDRRLFMQLEKELKARGIDVISAQSAIDSGISWPQECGAIIRGADAAAFLTSGELRGFAEAEFEQANAHRKLIIPLLVGDAPANDVFDTATCIHVDATDISQSALDTIVARVKDAFYPDD